MIAWRNNHPIQRIDAARAAENPQPGDRVRSNGCTLCVHRVENETVFWMQRDPTGHRSTWQCPISHWRRALEIERQEADHE